ncbi:SgcJ/EcaC family oxidoreductase [bacterium]|nr:SgcJ/EcaC family oxidoreductase [bacterium]
MENSTETIEKIAEQNFLKWAKLLETKDLEQVVELYSEEATFLPTLSDKFKKGQKEAEGYFKNFLEKDPSGKIIKQAVQLLSVDTYLHSGLYDFEVGPNETRSTVKARFTYVWKKNKNGEWQIIHHHSSMKPE